MCFGLRETQYIVSPAGNIKICPGFKINVIENFAQPAENGLQAVNQNLFRMTEVMTPS